MRLERTKSFLRPIAAVALTVSALSLASWRRLLSWRRLPEALEEGGTKPEKWPNEANSPFVFNDLVKQTKPVSLCIAHGKP
jgi:hypothetical protein